VGGEREKGGRGRGKREGGARAEVAPARLSVSLGHRAEREEGVRADGAFCLFFAGAMYHQPT